MSQVRTRRPVLTTPRLVAALSAAVMVAGLSLVGVAHAEGYRDHEGDKGYGSVLSDQRGSPGGSNRSTSSLDDRRQVRNRSVDSDESEDLDKLEPATPAGGLVAGTPCSTKAVACVSLGQKKSWLFTKDGDGNVVVNRGPVPVSTGGPGKETPLGDFVVEWKDKNHKSGEFFVPRGCKPPAAGCEGAPMNWSVFFAEGGIAFHEGTLGIRSSGCVRLTAQDAEFYYKTLQLGDRVEVRG